jgi:hypothetical protein
MNRTNLEKLASYLEGLPADCNHFKMNTYFQRYGTFRTYGDATLAGDCDTAACAVGHGPAAGIILATEVSDWADYGEKAFELASDEWVWCFSGGWSAVDNTPHGAAKRIRHLLYDGVPSDGWQQRCGYKPYMFANSDAQEPVTV